MRLSWFAFALPLLLIACTNRYLPDLAYEMRETAVFLEGSDYTCSGTVVAANMVLTAKHCVPGPDGEVTVIFANGEKRTGRTIWEADSRILDVGLIQFDGDARKHFMAVDCEPMEWGEPFAWIGNPSILHWNYGAGYVSSVDPVVDSQGTEHPMIPVHANFNPGDSGGGLISPDGHLRGVISAFLVTWLGNSPSQSGTGLMVPASAFCTEMESAL
jgi:S1-C subfamily serine protease